MPFHNDNRYQARGGNRVLAALPDQQFARLRPHLEAFDLRPGDVLAHAGDAITHFYFVETGLISMVASTPAGSTIAVAFVGVEGMAGACALLGAASLPYGLVVQLPGHSWRVPIDAFGGELLGGDETMAFVHHYVQVLLAQITQAAICNRFHSPRERLARWLAHTFDRAGSDEVPLTHEFIAHMMGGARSLVTQACNDLRRLEIIDYGRGWVRLLDARALRAQACECYATVTAVVNTLR